MVRVVSEGGGPSAYLGLGMMELASSQILLCVLSAVLKHVCHSIGQLAAVIRIFT